MQVQLMMNRKYMRARAHTLELKKKEINSKNMYLR
jgi:hypothetical protein